MGREVPELLAGDWVEETKPQKRRFQILAIHHKPGHPAPNVELAIEGNAADRITLSLFAVADASRFRRLS